MDIRALKVPDAYEITPRQHRDDRGVFLEWFKSELFGKAVGRPLRLAQANTSVSARGVIRGIHFAQVPPSQAKYVTCASGRVLDVVVDTRVGSPAFGSWDCVVLDDVDRRAVFLAEGLGHAFMSLADRSVVTYLCSEGYSPGREHGVHPLDPEIGIGWPADQARVLSPKDAEAATLAQAEAAGVLPNYAECLALYRSLAS